METLKEKLKQELEDLKLKYPNNKGYIEVKYSIDLLTKIIKDLK